MKVFHTDWHTPAKLIHRYTNAKITRLNVQKPTQYIIPLTISRCTVHPWYTVYRALGTGPRPPTVHTAKGSFPTLLWRPDCKCTFILLVCTYTIYQKPSCTLHVQRVQGSCCSGYGMMWNQQVWSPTQPHFHTQVPIKIISVMSVQMWYLYVPVHAWSTTPQGSAPG